MNADAVKAAAEALSDLCADELHDYPCPGHHRQAEAAVSAAEPIIRAAIAAEIRAQRDSVQAETEADRAFDMGMTEAADIAEG